MGRLRSSDSTAARTSEVIASGAPRARIAMRTDVPMGLWVIGM
jgi:hypothetical protein